VNTKRRTIRGIAAATIVTVAMLGLTACGDRDRDCHKAGTAVAAAPHQAPAPFTVPIRPPAPRPPVHIAPPKPVAPAPKPVAPAPKPAPQPQPPAPQQPSIVNSPWFWIPFFASANNGGGGC